jgi:hypothetical protein
MHGNGFNRFIHLCEQKSQRARCLIVQTRGGPSRKHISFQQYNGARNNEETFRWGVFYAMRDRNNYTIYGRQHKFRDRFLEASSLT